MTTSTYAPDTQVEIAWDSGVSAAAASRIWTDVSDWVELQDTITIRGGRSDERSACDANSMSLTLDNSDGRFTPENTSSPYYPNVRLGRPIRVTTRYPSDPVGNLMDADNASVETSLADWAGNTAFGAYPDLPTAVARSSTRAQVGSWSVLATWPTTTAGSCVVAPVSGLVIGRTYTASAYVWVPAGSPDPRLDVLFLSASARTSTKSAWVRLTATFTAVTPDAYLGVNVATATAGNQCWVDAAMVNEGPTAAAFTTAAPPDRTRFLGFVDSWVTSWPDGVDATATASVAASSRMARLGAATVMSSALASEIALDDPVLYFPLSEPEGSTQGAASIDRYGMSALLVPAGRAPYPQFGDEHGPVTDSSTAAKFAFGAGGRLKMSPGAAASSTFTVECVYCSISEAGSTQTEIVNATEAADGDYLLWLVMTNGQSQALLQDHGGSAINVGGGAVDALHDGLPHHLALVRDGSTLSLYHDGVLIDSDTAGGVGFSGAAAWSVGWLDTGSSGDAAALSHWAYFDIALTATRVADHAAAALGNIETAAQRLTDMARWANVPDTDFDATATELMVHVDPTGDSVVDAMRKVETTEGGVLYDAHNGALTYDSRSSRYQAAAAVVLSFAAGEIDAANAPAYDSTGLVNDVTATYAAGAVRALTQSSIDEYGDATLTPDLYTMSEAEAIGAATWLASVSADPHTRIPNLAIVDLTQIDAAKLPGILGLDVGSRVTVTGWPVQAAAVPDVFVEGYDEVIAMESHTLSLNVSDAATWLGIFILDDATRGVIDSPYRLGW